MTSVLVLFRVVGYGLLLLTLFDVISALIPLQLSNPAWQFSTAGGFVERSAVPLIGFVMAFYGNQEARKKREMLILRALSWISLLAGIFYIVLLIIFFITPPGLNDRAQEQLNSQFNPQIKQIEEFQTKVQSAPTTDIQNLMKNSKGVTTTDPQAFKGKLLQDAATLEKNLKDRAEIAKSSQRLSLLKNSVKWGLGSLVSAVLFIRIWANSSWAR